MTEFDAPPRARASSRAPIPSGYQRLRPNPTLLRQAIATLLAFAVPAFGVLYFLTVPTGDWLPVLIVQIVVSALFLLATWAFFRVGVWVDARGIVERGFFGMVTHTPIERIGSSVLVQAYYGGGADTMPQFFVCDHEGRQVVRLRGQFWSLESMAAVRDILGVPSTEQAEGVSTKEIGTQYPGLLYWFERRPILAVAGAGTVLVFAGALVYFGLRFFDSPPLAS